MMISQVLAKLGQGDLVGEVLWSAQLCEQIAVSLLFTIAGQLFGVRQSRSFVTSCSWDRCWVCKFVLPNYWSTCQFWQKGCFIIAPLEVFSISLALIYLFMNFDYQVASFFFRNLAISSCLRLEQQYQMIMQAQSPSHWHRKGKPLYQHNASRDFNKNPLISTNQEENAIFGKDKKDLADLERLAFSAVSKWRKKLLHASFLAWRMMQEDWAQLQAMFLVTVWCI